MIVLLRNSYIILTECVFMTNEMENLNLWKSFLEVILIFLESES